MVKWKNKMKHIKDYISRVNWTVLGTYVIMFNIAGFFSDFTMSRYIVLNFAFFLLSIMAWIFSYNTLPKKKPTEIYRTRFMCGWYKDKYEDRYTGGWTITKSNINDNTQSIFKGEPLSVAELDEICDRLNRGDI